jgi:Tfp pilus assembly protein PilE
MKREIKGSSLLEVLIAISLFAILSLGIARSQIVSNVTRASTLGNARAMQIAIALLETYTTMDPLTLGVDDNFSDTVSVASSNFRRTVSIATNSDVSRTVSVSVVDMSSAVHAQANLQITLATQGSS